MLIKNFNVIGRLAGFLMWPGGLGINQYGLDPVSVRQDLRQENNTLVIRKVILTAARRGL